MEQPEMHSIAIVLMIEAEVYIHESNDLSNTKSNLKDHVVLALGKSLTNIEDVSWRNVSCLSFVVDDNSDKVED